MMRWLVALAALGACAACSKNAETAPSSDAAQPSASSAGAAGAPEISSSMIGESWDEKLRRGETISLEGEFAGGDRRRVCKYAATTRPSGMRSPDWVLQKDGRCVWVSEAMKVFGDPAATLDAANVGRKVAVTATVVADGDGRLYLEATSAKALN